MTASTRPLLLLALLFAGCVIQPAERPPALPAWAKGLREPEVEVAFAPTELTTGDSALGSRGTPRDLTRPLPGRSTSAGAAAPAARNASPRSRTIEGTRAAAASRMETLFAGRYGQRVERGVQQFGYAELSHSAQGAVAGPVADDYRIGPGDELLVTVSGSRSDLLRLTVDRDGLVALPEVGPVAVARRRFDALEGLLSRAFAKRFKQIELSVSLGRLRRVPVRVLGLVGRPGALDVPARSSLCAVLSLAGGVLKTGSLRRIEIRRADGTVAEADLYDVLLGSSKAPPRIESGDVIRVGPLGETTAVAGLVRRPAIYELKGATSVDELLELAGGLTPFAFTPFVQLERTAAGRGRVTDELQLRRDGRRPVRDGEMLLVGAVEATLQPLVRVEGAVVRPGNYPFRAGLTLSGAIRRADGLTVDAFVRQAFVSRQLERSTESSLGKPSATRRIFVVDLAKALAGDPEHDLALQPLDWITIRLRTNSTVVPTVRIDGAVKQPGSYELTAGLRASDLVALAGNTTPRAYLRSAELVRPVLAAGGLEQSVRRVRFNLQAALDQPGGLADPLLGRGDRLMIRQFRRAQVEVEISGEVRFPGRYVYPTGARITDLIASGELLETADLRASVFTRQSVRRLQLERLAHLQARTQHLQQNALESLALRGSAQEAMAGKLSLRQSRGLIERNGQVDTLGRVVVDLSRSDLPSSASNLVLEDGDRLVVRRTQETISVVGMVFNPSTVVSGQGVSVETLLAETGGLLEDGDDDHLYVMRASGRVETVGHGESPLDDDALLYGGDVLLVPRRSLERPLASEVGDGIALARQFAETAFVLSRVADPKSSVQLNSVSSQPTTTNEVDLGAILREGDR